MGIESKEQCKQTKVICGQCGKCCAIDQRVDITEEFRRNHPDCSRRVSNPLLRTAIEATRGTTRDRLIAFFRQNTWQDQIIRTIARFIMAFKDRLVGEFKSDLLVLRKAIETLLASRENREKKERCLRLIGAIESFA